MKRLALLFALLLWCGPAAAEEVEPLQPDDVDGLEAWFKTDTLHRKLNANEHVSNWPDSSGNGHDLEMDGRAAQPIFMTLRLNRKPVVHIVKGAKWALNQPFKLDDHTIFIVYLSRFPERALFCHQGNDAHCILLHDSNDRMIYTIGTEQELIIPYSTPGTAADDYRITALGREDGLLKAFVNGADVSANSGVNEPLVVGKFFAMTYDGRGRRDGNGLRIAEMIFYDRYLTVAERNGVTQYLSDKFAIDVELAEEPAVPLGEPQDSTLAWLAADSEMDVNAPSGARIAWDRQEKIAAPLRHTAEGDDNTRLYSTRDGVALRLRVVLPLQSEIPDANIRLLLLQNGERYLDGEAESGYFGGVGKVGSSVVEMEATVELGAGEFIEVIAFGVGAEGPANLGPGAVLIAEPVTE